MNIQKYGFQKQGLSAISKDYFTFTKEIHYLYPREEVPHLYFDSNHVVPMQYDVNHMHFFLLQSKFHRKISLCAA